MSNLCLGDDEIVISGIAGRFPNCENVLQLQEHLMKNEDCVVPDTSRWDIDANKIPDRVGKVPNIQVFDSIFFGVHKKLAELMDPMTRMMMEVAYESVADAGINPQTLKGSNTAVFTGSGFSECEKTMFYEKIEQNGLGLTGGSRAMLPNRVSFSLGLNGPSVNIDAACCSSGNALMEAYRDIKSGICDAAIVGGTNLCVHPHLSYHLLLLEMLAPDGVHKCFDAKADGFTRSDSVVAVFVQRASQAKRVYCELKSVLALHVPASLTNNVMYPYAESQAQLMEQALKEAGIAPGDVNYVEADGSGIRIADAREAEAIDKVYNKNPRNTPLLIGSVKSNIGHAMPANTLNSLVKVITAMEKGVIPANLHYVSPPQDVEALAKGRLRVVAENTPWMGDYAAVNTTSYAGGVVHLVLKAFNKAKINGGQPKDLMPRLVTVSGRTENAVSDILKNLGNKPVDTEFCQLLYDLFETETLSHLYRGYIILPSQGLPSPGKNQEMKSFTGAKREIWYVFSGMGSQWPGMGEALMKIPVFAEAARKCDVALKPYGIDIVRILTEKDPKMFDNIVNSFVGIATVQIGLVDILKDVGLEPDMIIGHSVGELGCAYADGCFTAEEMILSALSRGLASTETELPFGSMAAVGLGYEDIKPLCPPDIDVACHNGPGSVTISGPAESMKKFVAELQAKAIFAREVPCSNIAYHSRYIAPAGPKLMEYLQKVIKEPKVRSKRWVSSSVARSEWGSARARLSSAEYHTNNLLSPVLFDETSRLIPPNAITIEIAPHGLLQAILKRSLPEECVNIPLTRRGHNDNAEMVLAALGKLYNAGVQINPGKLYPRVPYPVSRGTDSISPLIQWDHGNDWYVSWHSRAVKIKEGEKMFPVDLNDHNYQFIQHHKIRGDVVIPFTIYVTYILEIWKSLYMNKPLACVVFENLRLHQKILRASNDETTEITVMVQKGTGLFEVTKDSVLLATGSIRMEDTTDQEFINIGKLEVTLEENLTENDIYAELHYRGFNYNQKFRNIKKMSLDATSGSIHWKNNLTTFLNSLFQFHSLGIDTRETQVPIAVQKITMDMQSFEKSAEMPVKVYRDLNVIATPGAQIQGIKLAKVEPDASRESISLISEVSSELVPSESWLASQSVRGEPRSLNWTSASESQVTKSSVKVEHASISQRDLLLAQGKSLSDGAEGRDRLSVKTFGLEFSGKNAQGAKVMGICASGTLRSHLVPDPEYTWPVPVLWTSEEAATVPLSYAVAYAALFLKGNLRKKDKVLVHDGCSEFGQASINIALKEGCQVYTTYKSEHEKKILIFRYPEIPERRVCQYEGGNYREDVLMDTKGIGVNVVITGSNNLNEIETSLCIADNRARVFVIGDLEATIHESVGMEIFLKEVSLYSIVPEKIANARSDVKRVLAVMIRDGIESGAIKPLSHKVYGSQELQEAFDDGISGNFAEKIVIHVQPEKPSEKMLVIPRLYCPDTKSYLIISNQSNFGPELADWLITRGAKKIVLASGSKKSRYQDFRSRFWEKYGITAVCQNDLDLSEKHKIKTLLNEARKLGEIDGIFELKDDEDSGKDSSMLTRMLDEESKLVCQNLRFHVVCVPATNPKKTLDLMNSRKNKLQGFLLVCSADEYGIKVNCLKCFDEALMSSASSAAIISEETKREGNKTLKHKQDKSNHSADTGVSEAALFKAALYEKDKYIGAKSDIFN